MKDQPFLPQTNDFCRDCSDFADEDVMSDAESLPPSKLSSMQDCLMNAKAGDAAARERLFAACRSYVGLLARSNVEKWMQAKVDASDIVQQTLLDAHRDFDRFAGKTEGEWLAWLRQILAHNTGDLIRHFGTAEKRAAKREVSLGNAGPDDSAGLGWEPMALGATPSQIAVAHESELLVAEAIEKLPDDYREVIILRNIQRLPFDEVASRLNRSRPAAQMLWARAVQKLKEFLPEIEMDSNPQGHEST